MRSTIHFFLKSSLSKRFVHHETASEYISLKSNPLRYETFLRVMSRDNAMDSEKFWNNQRKMVTHPSCLYRPILLEDVEILFEEPIYKQDVSQILTLISSPFLDCDTKDKQLLLDTLIEFHPNIDYNVTRTLLWTCIDSNLQLPSKLLCKILNSKHSQLPQEIAHLLLKYYCSKGLAREALDIKKTYFKERCGYKHHEFIADLLIAYAQTGFLAKVNDITKKYSERIETSWEPYIALMYIHVLKKDFETANIIYETHLTNERLPLCYYTMQLFYALALHGYSDSVPKYVYELACFRETKNTKKILCFLLQLIDMRQEKLALNLICSVTSTAINQKILRDPGENYIFQYIFYRKLFRNTSNLTDLPKLFLHLESTSIKPLKLLLDSARDGDLKKYTECLDVLTSKSTIELKPLHFWPLLAECAKNLDLTGIFYILEMMIKKYQITPCFDTLKNFVTPYIHSRPYFLNLLLLYPIPPAVIHNANLYVTLCNKHTFEATMYMERYNAIPYMYSLLFLANIYSFTRVRNVQSFLSVCYKLRTPKDVCATNDLCIENIQHTSVVPIETQLKHVIGYISSNNTLLRQLISDRNLIPPSIITKVQELFDCSNSNTSRFVESNYNKPNADVNSNKKLYV